ncbi:MAG TPA: hypothetical protein VJC11_00600 [Patescibacteria group bacterium]|nr:hypothetical protein [Patescibacteria group bacterium]
MPTPRPDLAVFLDANLPPFSSQRIDLGVSDVSRIDRDMRIVASDAEIFENLERYAIQHQVTVILFTRDRTFRLDAKKDSDRVRVVVLQEWHNLIPEVVAVGDMNSDDLARVIRQIFFFSFNPPASLRRQPSFVA